MNIERFAKKYPVGSAVRYYPIISLKNFREVEIRSNPWELTSGEIIVKISSVHGGVSIDHIRPVL